MAGNFCVARIKVERSLSDAMNIKMEIKLTHKVILKVFNVSFQADYIIV